MKSKAEDDEDIVRELEELKKDPKKWKAFMESQAERALKHWPGRKTR